MLSVPPGREQPPGDTCKSPKLSKSAIRCASRHRGNEQREQSRPGSSGHAQTSLLHDCSRPISLRRILTTFGADRVCYAPLMERSLCPLLLKLQRKNPAAKQPLSKSAGTLGTTF